MDYQMEQASRFWSREAVTGGQEPIWSLGGILKLVLFFVNRNLSSGLSTSHRD